MTSDLDLMRKAAADMEERLLWCIAWWIRCATDKFHLAERERAYVPHSYEREYVQEARTLLHCAHQLASDTGLITRPECEPLRMFRGFWDAYLDSVCPPRRVAA